MKKYALIVAGGSGSRMKSTLPKQFLELDDRPILMHTLDAFYNERIKMAIILVLPQDHISTWQTLVEKYEYTVPHQVVTGGDTRFDSVKNGLMTINESGVVAIHDGARPLISEDVILRTIEQAQKSGSGIAAVPVKDSLRQITDGDNKAVDRSDFLAIQTPQTFKVELIKKAFDVATSNEFTDDASVLEAFGEHVVLVEGSYANLKVTTSEDLIMAHALLASRK